MLQSKINNWCIMLSLMLLSGCSACGLAEGDLHDAQKASIKEKLFMNSLSFKGVVLRRKYCDSCDDRGKYQIIILLQETDPKEIPFGYQVWSPDYAFDIVNKQLNISVTKQLFESAVKDIVIEKRKSSDYIVIKGKQHRLISEKQYQWLPN